MGNKGQEKGWGGVFWIKVPAKSRRKRNLVRSKHKTPKWNEALKTLREKLSTQREKGFGKNYFFAELLSKLMGKINLHIRSYLTTLCIFYTKFTHTFLSNNTPAYFTYKFE